MTVQGSLVHITHNHHMFQWSQSFTEHKDESVKQPEENRANYKTHKPYKVLQLYQILLFSDQNQLYL